VNRIHWQQASHKSNSQGFDIAALRGDLIECAADVAMALLGEPNRALSSKRELRFGRKGSLAVAIQGQKAGCWFDHENDAGGDLLDLVQRERGGSFRDAIIYASQFIGCATLRPVARSPRSAYIPTYTGKDNSARALALWHEATPITGTLAEAYLGQRHVIEPALEAGHGACASIPPARSARVCASRASSR
jgi:putative DNA primase/helicase